ncbi:uncharacterized protein EAF01_010608 [Botrytis porri]|uniref:Uncharacterized protein n=1 Tax=Botrytis porri TaxID=87229 RepID=A0A4Z1KCD1_9HELO|nr:uncharacterized protein EAF01_010608 [Botrytis porri]KAF7890799.1 hypothetical protein EAF01_010608 [Botrytis porri]TGO81852.1 hypothetical protein BPOR_0995g00050 [Botrytis porri]
MAFTLSNNTATLSSMTSLFITSTTSSPTITTSNLNAMDTKSTSCCTITNGGGCPFPTTPLIALIILAVLPWIFLVITCYVLSEYRSENDKLEKAERQGIVGKPYLKKHHEKVIRQEIWEEDFQRNAARMMHIQVLDEKCNHAVNPENDILFRYKSQTAQEVAWIEIRDSIRAEFRKKYIMDQSDIEVDAMGKYGPVPRNHRLSLL